MLGHFSEKEFVDPVMIVDTISPWNRLAISIRIPAGAYELKKKAGANDLLWNEQINILSSVIYFLGITSKPVKSYGQ